MHDTTREQAIIDLIVEKGFMSVNELSESLYTSPSSIRRDLSRLEQKNMIKRTHGGAVLAENTRVSPFYTRRTVNLEQKRSAAQKAAFLIHDAMSVMLDGSSTALQMLPHIKSHNNIRVFTNGIYTYQSAVDMGIEAYCLGGGPSTDNQTLSGNITENAVRELYADILFFSSKCIGDDGEITDIIDGENNLRKVMLAHSKTHVFLYDSSKLGTRALFRLCNVSDVDYSFSDLS